MIRIVVGVIVLLTFAAPALARDAAPYDTRTPLFDQQGRGLHSDDPMRMAGAYIGPTLSPLCTGGEVRPAGSRPRTSRGAIYGILFQCPTKKVTWSGACVEGKASGQGRMVWRSSYGRDVYEGTKQAGKMHGRGTFTWAGGNRYEGEWRDSEKHGRGTYTWADGESWTCQWRNNKHVEGTCTKR